MTGNTLLTKIAQACKQFEIQYSQRQQCVSKDSVLSHDAVISELEGIHLYRNKVVEAIADLRKSQLDAPSDSRGCADEEKPDAVEEEKTDVTEESMTCICAQRNGPHI